MNPTEKIFTSEEIATVVGVPHDKMPQTEALHSALNAVHFAIVKALSNFGLFPNMARGLASAIGVAASTNPRAGWVVIRRQERPQTGCWVEEGEPIWVQIDTHEVAMYTDYYQFVAALSRNSGACLVLDIGGIEAETIAKLETLAAAK